MSLNVTRPEMWWKELPPELSFTRPAELVRWALGEASDPRTVGWPTMATPSFNWSMSLMYLLFVFLAPKVMEKREAWDLKPVMVVYNVCVIVMNLYMFIEIFHQTVLLDMAWVGNPVDYSERGLGLAAVLYLYYTSKLIDYLDTFFLVMRKNHHQLSFLHVYHHTAMYWLWWLGIRFAAGGDTYFSAWVNCLVHVVMYSYYLAACLGIRLQGKRYVTQLQLLQFVLVISHSAYSLYLDTPYPQWILIALVVFLVSLFVLFSNFYVQEYLKGSRRRSQQKLDAAARQPSVDRNTKKTV
eukprot:TRINITY_DN26192_c0_g1_i1.p1 TRINITY_DN26192_c0_g1~~TRINITY_DN26192_c0_g1_i1.p1  ORF type:complete len:297 (+),score=114.31 TRINITY_DN26192_c0_g1_i1:59-949(+)